jgi:hypothetical protein
MLETKPVITDHNVQLVAPLKNRVESKIFNTIRNLPVISKSDALIETVGNRIHALSL